MKNILFLITLISAAAFVAGCEKESSTAQQIDKVKTETKQAVQDMKDYTFAQKAEFVEKMQGQLTALNQDLDQLAAKIEKSSDAVKAEAKPRLQALRDQSSQLNKQLDEPGCPWQNGYAESFNGRFRRECLNRELIYTLSEGRVVFEDWRRYYNQERPHRSLGLQTPAQFAKNQREQGSGSSRATPAFHRNLEWQQNNKLKPPETVSSQVV